MDADELRLKIKPLVPLDTSVWVLIGGFAHMIWDKFQNCLHWLIKSHHSIIDATVRKTCL